MSAPSQLREDIRSHLSHWGRPKRSFASREDAKRFLRDHPNPKYMLIYECPLCTQWHMATGYDRAAIGSAMNDQARRLGR